MDYINEWIHSIMFIWNGISEIFTSCVCTNTLHTTPTFLSSARRELFILRTIALIVHSFSKDIQQTRVSVCPASLLCFIELCSSLMKSCLRPTHRCDSWNSVGGTSERRRDASCYRYLSHSKTSFDALCAPELARR